MDLWRFSTVVELDDSARRPPTDPRMFLVILRLEPAENPENVPENIWNYPNSGHHSIVFTCRIHPDVAAIENTRVNIMVIKETNHSDIYNVELPFEYKQYANLVFNSETQIYDDTVAAAIAGIREARELAQYISPDPIPAEYLPASFELGDIIDPDTHVLSNEIDDELKPLMRVVFRDVYRQIIDGFCQVDFTDPSGSYILK